MIELSNANRAMVLDYLKSYTTDTFTCEKKKTGIAIRGSSMATVLNIPTMGYHNGQICRDEILTHIAACEVSKGVFISTTMMNRYKMLKMLQMHSCCDMFILKTDEGVVSIAPASHPEEWTTVAQFNVSVLKNNTCNISRRNIIAIINNCSHYNAVFDPDALQRAKLHDILENYMVSTIRFVTDPAGFTDVIVADQSGNKVLYADSLGAMNAPLSTVIDMDYKHVCHKAGAKLSDNGRILPYGLFYASRMGALASRIKEGEHIRMMTNEDGYLEYDGVKYACVGKGVGDVYFIGPKEIQIIANSKFTGDVGEQMKAEPIEQEIKPEFPVVVESKELTNRVGDQVRRMTRKVGILDSVVELCTKFNIPVEEIADELNKMIKG